MHVISCKNQCLKKHKGTEVSTNKWLHTGLVEAIPFEL